VISSLLVIADEATLGQTVLTKHLGDLLSALLQLAYAPLKKPSADDDQRVKYSRWIAEQAGHRKELADLLDRVYQPLAVKYLLVIQGGRAPKWLRAVCGRLLTGRLLKKRGVSSVVFGVLDMGGAGGGDDGAALAQRCEIVARVLASPPAAADGYDGPEDYFAKVCPQILELFLNEESPEALQLHAVASACVKAVAQRWPRLADEHLFRPMLAPLYNLCEGDEFREELGCEKQLERGVEVAHLVFVSHSEPDEEFLRHLAPVLPALLELHCSLHFGASHLKSAVKEILSRYLRTVTITTAVATMRGFAFREQCEGPEGALQRKGLRFEAAEGGGIRARVTDEPEAAFHVSDDERSIALVDLLEATNDRKLTAEFFMALLSELSAMMVEQDEGDGNAASMAEEELLKVSAKQQPLASVEAKLLAIDEELERTMARLRRSMMTVRLLGLFSEDASLQDDLTKDTARLLAFVGLTLDRAAKGCRQRPKGAKAERDMDEGPSLLETQSVTTALTLLGLKATAEDVKLEEWKAMGSLQEDLTALAKFYPEPGVRQTAERLRRLVATHGLLSESRDAVRNKCSEINRKTEEARKLALEMRNLGREATMEENLLPYERALSQLSDPLLPVRGHAIIELTSLLAGKDEEAVAHAGKLVEVFRQCLEEEDTYIYLSAINGLTACGDLRPGPVVDALTREFANVDDRKFEKADAAMELRTKLGEALVRLTRNLGEMTPAYRERLINPFLSQLSHPDPLVRASCLSNLGEVCQNLRFGLGGMTQEVMLCLRSVLDTDASSEPRRAAVLVVTLLLRGLGRDALYVLRDELRDIWR